MCQGQCHWPIYTSLLPSPLFALYFMVELYLHAMAPHAEPAQTSASQWGVPKCCSGQQLHLELATVARPQVRALARFNYLPLVFVLAFAPFQQLRLLCRLAWLLGLFGLFACLFVCSPVCLSVCQADCILRP